MQTYLSLFSIYLPSCLLPLPRGSEITFTVLCLWVELPPVYHLQVETHSIIKQGIYEHFKVIGLTQLGMEPDSTTSEAEVSIEALLYYAQFIF